jgi:signal transduction histidine kinase
MYKIIKEKIAPKLEYFMKTQDDIESTSAGVIVQNLSGGITRINQAACRLLGVAGGEKERRERALEKMRSHGFQTIFSKETITDVRVRDLSVHSPQKLDLGVISIPMFDTGGEVSGRISILRDDTLRVGLEKESDSVLTKLDQINKTLERRVAARTRQLSKVNEELLAKGAELERLNENLRRANKRLNEKTLMLKKANLELESLDKMKSNLISNVSHELKTPLIALKGYLDLFLANQLGPVAIKQRKGLKVMMRAVDRLEVLINNLVQVTRLEETKGELFLTRFDMIETAEEAISFLSTKAEERNIKIERRYPSKPLLVRADREKINQILLNLISNAIKFNKENGCVKLRLSRLADKKIRIQVSDWGVGIPRSERKQVFERFHQVDSSTGRRYGGIGLGLSITKELVELHGGKISFTSSAGKGTTFTVVLPEK